MLSLMKKLNVGAYGLCAMCLLWFQISGKVCDRFQAEGGVRLLQSRHQVPFYNCVEKKEGGKESLEPQYSFCGFIGVLGQVWLFPTFFLWSNSAAEFLAHFGLLINQHPRFSSLQAITTCEILVVFAACEVIPDSQVSPRMRLASISIL